jgi:hypothetical protein
MHSKALIQGEPEDIRDPPISDLQERRIPNDNLARMLLKGSLCDR